MGDWSWIDLNSISSNISSSEISLSSGQGVVNFDIVCHLSGLLGWGDSVVRWLVYNPVIEFSPDYQSILVGVNYSEPVLGGSELSNLLVIAVVSKSGLVFHDVEQTGLLGAVNSS